MSGKNSSKSALLPPTMIESVPSIALGSPPLTGASSIRIFFSASLAATSRLTSGAIELMSMRIEPGLADSMTPPFPRTTSLTWGELGSIVMITSVFAATSCGEAPFSAPAATTSSRAAVTMS